MHSTRFWKIIPATNSRIIMHFDFLFVHLRHNKMKCVVFTNLKWNQNGILSRSGYFSKYAGNHYYSLNNLS